MSPFQEYRQKHSLTQQQFAELIGGSQTLVSLVESGFRQVPAGRVILIESKTGISRHQLRPDLYPEAATA